MSVIWSAFILLITAGALAASIFAVAAACSILSTRAEPASPDDEALARAIMHGFPAGVAIEASGLRTSRLTTSDNASEASIQEFASESEQDSQRVRRSAA